MRTTLPALVLLIASTASMPVRAAATVTFTPVGDLGGGLISRLSADGSTIVGFTNYGEAVGAFRWTRVQGKQELGYLSDILYSTASGVSADGSVVVGTSQSANGDEAFRWTAGGGMRGLGGLSATDFYSYATGVSADGSVVVGYSAPSGFGPYLPEAFRWTAAGGMQGLGHLPGGTLSQANAVSADGSVVFGAGDSTSGSQLFRWTSAGGMQGLGGVPGYDWSTSVSGVSADGSTAVGYVMTSAFKSQAFRWTSAGGMQGLGYLPGGTSLGQAGLVSDDGSIVVGVSASATGNEGFFWDAEHGMRRLKDVLVSDYELDLPGWTFGVASISAGGDTLGGIATDPAGQLHLFTTTVPEPASLPLLALGGLGALAALRHGRRRD